MDKAMRGPCRTRSSVEGAAGCAMARGLVSFPHLARCNPAGLDRMVPAPSPTRKYLLGRLSLLCALLAGLVVLVPPAAVSAVAASPHGVALIIGNADYEHRDVPDVTFAHRDADAFRRYVVDVLGYDAANVVDLRDATRRELFDALGTKSDARSLLWSYLDPDEGSDVVVFYSGHGVPGVNDKRGYLLPVDADPKAAEDDGYPIDLLYRNVGGLAEARSVRVWVYLDACFSGASHEGGLIRDASPVFVEAALPAGLGEKVMSLAAASGKQVASWDEGARHGLFTNHLLDALYGKGDADGDGAGEGTGGEGVPGPAHDASGAAPAPEDSAGEPDGGGGGGCWPVRGPGGRFRYGRGRGTPVRCPGRRLWTMRARRRRRRTRR